LQSSLHITCLQSRTLCESHVTMTLFVNALLLQLSAALPKRLKASSCSALNCFELNQINHLLISHLSKEQVMVHCTGRICKTSLALHLGTGTWGIVFSVSVV